MISNAKLLSLVHFGSYGMLYQWGELGLMDVDSMIGPLDKETREAVAFGFVLIFWMCS